MITLETLRVLAFGIIAASLLSSCAPQQRFVWGSYESELYGYYKDPKRLKNLMDELEIAISDGEKLVKNMASNDGKPRRIAPGLYAEYGYLLMISRQGAKAKSYFEKEKQTWPESAILMEKMIATVDRNSGTGTKQGVLKSGEGAR